MIRRWFIYTFVSAIVGFILGYALLWVWFWFRVIILGYGDSGPSWVDTVNDVVFWGGLGISILGGQLLFFSKPLRKH